MRDLTLLIILLAVVGCGEMGHDPDGPNHAYLALQSDNGKFQSFYLGGYKTVHDCLAVLNVETKSAAERNNEFWTNPDFTYGGFKQAGWTRHVIVGTKCETLQIS